jgi:hypothetical protein
MAVTLPGSGTCKGTADHKDRSSSVGSNEVRNGSDQDVDDNDILQASAAATSTSGCCNLENSGDRVHVGEVTKTQKTKAAALIAAAAAFRAKGLVSRIIPSVTVTFRLGLEVRVSRVGVSRVLGSES